MEQMTLTGIGPSEDEPVILKKDFEAAQAAANRMREARNMAASRIRDAEARYIKEKTRARSKKAAMEKEAILTSGRFAALEIYETRDSIHEAYGWDFITEAECDRLQELWDEREALKKKTVDGVYIDEVTHCMTEAITCVLELYTEELDAFDELKRRWDKQQERYRQWKREQDEDYRDWKNGWGKYRERTL